MLRRKPTALTISPEDLATFEETYAKKVAYIHYRKTGEDPNGWFSNHNSSLHHRHHQGNHNRHASTDATAAPNPDDELKPLPGDKARIVRSREDRIMGGTTTGSGQQGGSGTR